MGKRTETHTKHPSSPLTSHGQILRTSSSSSRYTEGIGSELDASIALVPQEHSKSTLLSKSLCKPTAPTHGFIYTHSISCEALAYLDLGIK